MRPALVPFILLILLVSIIGCGRSSSSGQASNSSIAPVPYCTTSTTFSDGITVTGTANYEYRTNGNGAVASPKPIRHAEVRVTDSAGTVFQCGETNGSGQFSLSLPANDGDATITVVSRADNAMVKAYVLTNPQSNTFHGISTKVTLDESKSVGTLTARATGSLEGGAFNILDRILDANIFIRAETSGCSSTFSNCSSFTVAPLVYAYWSPGVNPGDYFGIPALSFYLKGENKLYILGGIGGDVDNSDTDHFDNSIVLHEYGHFIEDHYSITNSPGGAHTGDTILDPRLAWGEAWANYFQAAVTGVPVYRDTSGTPLGTPQVYFNENLESGVKDTTMTLGEANFREFSITRALVDYTDTNDDGDDGLSGSFAEFWTLFSASTGGFASSSHHFRDVGLFYSLQAGLAGGSDWSQIQAGEFQLASREHYGNTLTVGGSCSGISIQADDIPDNFPEDGSPENSNQFASNDFYQYTHGGGNLSLSLTYTTNSSNPADLDLYLYRSDYQFGAMRDVVGFSDTNIGAGSGMGSESFSVANLAAGTYMININVNTLAGLGSAASYTLKINGATACPD